MFKVCSIGDYMTVYTKPGCAIRCPIKMVKLTDNGLQNIFRGDKTPKSMYIHNPDNFDEKVLLTKKNCMLSIEELFGENEVVVEPEVIEEVPVEPEVVEEVIPEPEVIEGEPPVEPEPVVNEQEEVVPPVAEVKEQVNKPVDNAAKNYAKYNRYNKQQHK
jgi:hypothetical protein